MATSRDEAIEAAGRAIAAGLALRDSLRQAAELAWPLASAHVTRHANGLMAV